MTAPRNTERPCPAFTREELTYLQDLLDGERAARFNFYMETLNESNTSLPVRKKPGISISLPRKFVTKYTT